MKRKQIPLRLSEEAEIALNYLREQAVNPSLSSRELPSYNEVINSALISTAQLARMWDDLSDEI